MIKSATIIEVILALVIIMLTMGIALMIYLNITNSLFTMQKFNAHLLINDISINMIKSPPSPLSNSGGQAGGLKGGLDEVIEKEELVINKSITPYKGIPNLSVLHLEVLDKHNKKLAERTELIITDIKENPNFKTQNLK